MFTTIAKLQNSHALREPVLVLETHLRIMYPTYTPLMHFPLFEIGLSNGDDDMEWVLNEKSTHSTDAVPDVIRNALGDTLILLRKGLISAAFGSARAGASEHYMMQVKQYMELLQVPEARAAIMCDGNVPELAWFKHHFLRFYAARSSVEDDLAVTQGPSFVAPSNAAAWQAVADPSWQAGGREAIQAAVDCPAAETDTSGSSNQDCSASSNDSSPAPDQ